MPSWQVTVIVLHEISCLLFGCSHPDWCEVGFCLLPLVTDREIVCVVHNLLQYMIVIWCDAC